MKSSTDVINHLIKREQSKPTCSAERENGRKNFNRWSLPILVAAQDWH